MTIQITKQSINSIHNNTKLNINLTNVLIDKTLTESTSIMYIRQATYYYLLRLNGWSRKDLHKAIKQRAEINAMPYNKGVLVKESQVASYCIEKRALLFSSVKINKNNFELIISKIAIIMQKNKLSFSYLNNILKQEKDSTESGAGKKIKTEVDSTESGTSKKIKTEVDFESVVEFIKNTTQENRLNLVEVLTKSIKNYVDNKEEEEESEEAAA